MIHIDRSRIAKPASLTSPDGAGHREYLRAVAYYRTPQTKAYKFTKYKEADVITALNILFNNKCAYCEGKITNTGPIEVEHFRPKGKIKDVPNHQGYWWLADEWTNLLASCIDCNRNRTQILYSSQDGQQLSQSEKLSGKHDNFPISGQRATCANDDHNLEDPLLIDPTCVDPGLHLDWKVIAQIPLVTSTTLYGKTSIDLYGLNRSKLVEERRELQLRLEEDFLSLLDMIKTVAEEPSAERREILIGRLERCINRFFKHTEEKNEYSAFAKHIVHTKFAEVSEAVTALYDSIATKPVTT
ncbi:hypothetical protein ACSZN6_01355 [Aeromonas hydrophila]|uniref:hypothetical protein n=1 Tax=Aeromonas hydrophila TaxID=644 RepID=UPI003305D530